MATSSVMHNQEFLTLGTHCSDPMCHQLDFLPFECPSCSLPFCADHWRPPQGHECAKFDSTKADNRIPSCPLCSQPVSFPVGQDPNIAMDRHLTTTCPTLHRLNSDASSSSSSGTSTPVNHSQSSNHAAAAKLQQQKLSGNVCAERRCTTKLVVAPITCSRCRLKYCPKHRFDKDHDCLAQQQRTREREQAKSTSSGSSGLLSKFKSSTAVTATSNNGNSSSGGLAALRRAQAAVSKKLLDPSFGPSTLNNVTSTQSPSVSVASQTVLNNHVQQTRTTTTTKPGGIKAATVGLVGSKTDKRALAEQISAKKALDARAKRGLLTEDEKVKYATLQALEVKSGGKGSSSSSKEGCLVS
ncbi:hypothetical protein ACM66B_003357 [Microbotryomycetes sp. NB124-2]